MEDKEREKDQNDELNPTMKQSDAISISKVSKQGSTSKRENYLNNTFDGK